jgi:acid phosphatase type 7
VTSLYIYYKYGDAATGDWSSEFKLRVPPLAGKQPPDRPTQVLLFDDMGRGSLDMSYTWNEWGRPAVYTAMATAADVRNGVVDAVYLGGDLSYADGYLSSWDFFLNMISPVTSGAVFMSTMGNHESAWPDSPSYFETVKSSGGECGWPTSTLFPSPFPAKNDMPWWSYDIGLIHLVGISTEHNFTIGSPQWIWLKNDLANVDRAVTPWIIFGGHRAMYVNSWFNIGESSDVNVAAMLQSNIEPLLYEYKVDVGFYGHNHVYQRHSAVYQNKVMQKSTQTVDSEGNTIHVQKDPNATVHMVVGSAGALFTKNALDPAPEWNELYVYEYGYARVRAVSASRLEWEFVSSESNLILDRMVILQSSRDSASSSARSTKELSTGEEAAIGIFVSLFIIVVVSINI